MNLNVAWVCIKMVDIHWIRRFIKKRRIQSDILFGSTLILLLSIFLIMGYTYYTNEKNTKLVLAQAEDRVRAASAELQLRIENTLTDIEYAVRTYAPLVNTWDTSQMATDFYRIHSLTETLMTSPYMTSLFFGMKDGFFYEVVPPGQLDYVFKSKGMLMPEGTTSVSRIILRDHKTVEDRDVYENWVFYSQDTNMISSMRKGELTNYNHRKRSWYVNAMKSQGVVWSPIYIFKSALQGKAGITASQSVIDRNGQFLGVFGADTTLDRISDLLSTFRLTKNSAFFIIDDKNHVLASSSKKQNVIVKDEQFDIMKVDAFGDLILKDAVNRLTEKQHRVDFMFFDSKDTRYVLHELPFPKVFANDWKIVVIIPQYDFINGLSENFDNLMAYSFIILIVSFVLAYRMAIRISTPIRQISQEALKIQNLELDSKPIMGSPIYEIDELANAMRSLKATMQSFSYYIPKNLVKKMLNAKQTVQIGGKVRNVTLMFTDIQGFTTISEKFKPEALVLYLSEYFEELTDIIMENNGTVDKYIGDAIMAFWGAPVQDRNQNFNACRTALLCQKRLEDLNRRWKSEGKPVFFTRIGVHAGDVIIGNIGSSERMNYSALGDNVNLGSRLEELNKYYGTKIIVSEVVYAQAKEHFLFRDLDRVAVKGKDKSVGIYELVAQISGDMTLLPTDEQTDYCTKFEKAYKLYLTRQFHEALVAFQKILKEFRSDDPSVLIYVHRCQEFIKTPPPNEWDGSYTMTTK